MFRFAAVAIVTAGCLASLSSCSSLPRSQADPYRFRFLPAESESGHPDDTGNLDDTGAASASTAGEPVSAPPPFRLEGERGALDETLARRELRLSFHRVPLDEALLHAARLAQAEIMFDPEAVSGHELTLDMDAISLRDFLSHVERTFPVALARRGRVIEVRVQSAPEMSILVYPLPGGLVRRRLGNDFDSLRQLSFISRSHESTDSPSAELSSSAAEDPALSHLEAFLNRLPELVAWPEGSHWYLDERRNVLIVRSTARVLDSIEQLMGSIVATPTQIQVETRFVELSEDDSRDLGVELGLLADAAVSKRRGDVLTTVGADSATRFGLPSADRASGLRLSFLGVLSQPQFSSVLHAIEIDGAGEVLSAPSVTTVNNSRATMAITTNLPFVENYRPVVDRELVASEGISRSEQSVALVAEINDQNFTGIVLNVTPSVGHGAAVVQLHLQPVVRDRVGEITISEGALVEGVATPAIARPIIETRFLDTQMSIPDGATVVLGGLKKSVVTTRVTGVPLLRHIPILGRLFERETLLRERRDLIIFVTARIVSGAGSQQ